MKAYIVEDPYRNNHVLVHALDAEGARTAAKNTKELAHVEWIDLQVRQSEHVNHKEHLIEKRELLKKLETKEKGCEILGNI